MQKLLEQCYCQKLELKREDTTLHGELCIVSISLPKLLEHKNNILHSQELAYFLSLTHDKRQLSYLLGRFADKQALIQYGIKAAFTDILIEPGVFHFPVIHHPGNEKLQLSDSHTEMHGIALIYPEIHPMGIDLELVNSNTNFVIETQMVKEEIQLLNNLSNMNKEEKYALLWTIKEALSKVLRTGMTTPFEIYAINSMKAENNYWISEFKNFTQYKGISFLLDNLMCSIVLPKRTEMNINITEIQAWFMRHNLT